MREQVVEVGASLRLIAPPRELRASLTDALTYPNPDAKRAAKLGLWYRPDPFLSNYTHEGADLIVPRGAAGRVRAACSGLATLRWLDKRTHAPCNYPSRVMIDRALEGRGIKPTDRQLAAVAALVARQTAYLRAPTGIGKSLVMALAIAKAGERALVIVPDTGLRDQFVATIESTFGKGYVGLLRSKPHRLAAVLVATYAMAWRVVKVGGDWFRRLRAAIGVLVCDELQYAAAPTVLGVVEAFPTFHRWGCSADERRKDERELLIYDAFARPADHISVAEAVEEGRIIQARVIVVRTHVRDLEYERAMWGRLCESCSRAWLKDEWGERPVCPNCRVALSTERGCASPKARRDLFQVADETIRTSELRNDLIADLAVRDVKAGHSVLILVRRLEHVETLHARIVKFIECGVLRGGASHKKNFSATKSALEAGTLRCAIGTSVTFQGFDVRRLDRGIIAVPAANNEMLLEQMLGRFRRVSVGKDDAVVRYLWDEHLFPSAGKKILARYRDLVSFE